MRDRNAPLSRSDLDGLDWDKMDGLLPAVVQHEATGQVLMLAYMSRESLEASLGSGFATFYSRSRRRLWEKGETSGNRLAIRGIYADCDGDSLLVKAQPSGPACHLGTTSCFSEGGPDGVGFLAELGSIVHQRAAGGGESSYTARLLNQGIARIAQKIGEEGVEVALAAVGGSKEECAGEIADLAYHLTVLMEAKGLAWADVAAELRSRHRPDRDEPVSPS